MKDAYAAINRGDLEAFLSLIDPEVEFNSLIAELEGQTWRGHDAVRDWGARVKSSRGGLHYEAEEVRASATARWRSCSSLGERAAWRCRKACGVRREFETGGRSGGAYIEPRPRPSKPPGCRDRPCGPETVFTFIDFSGMAA